MLAATAMVAVLAASLYTTLTIGMRARDTATKTVQMVRKCDAAFAFLKEDLQAAAGPGGVLAGPFLGGQSATEASSNPITTGGSGPGAIGSLSLAGFGGNTDDVLCFYASLSDADANISFGDIKKVEYACVSSPGPSGGSSIVRRVTGNLLAPTTPASAEETICTDVRSFTLTFFDGTTWQENWDSNAMGTVLPLAVQATLELNTPGASARDAVGYRMTRVLLIPGGQVVDPNAIAGSLIGGIP
jgi:hypothetical protein